jgi:WD40 repeat protein
MRELEVESGGPIWDLVAEFLERRERGEAVDIDSFVRSYPDVADRLREALAGFEWMEAKASPTHASMDEVLPRTFGNYQLLRVIGRGGMGCVYEAFHRPLKRHVAVKALPPHLSNVREFRLRFLREARVIASLHHTHIAPVFEVGQIGRTLYLAMPFIDGPNLRELTVPLPDDHPVITRTLRARLPKPFTPAYFRWVADIGIQAADALAHAHAHGVVHRDVKPSNLLLDEHGQIWIVDFGLAKAPTHPTVTQPGELIGTLRYASPEQIRGESFDQRSDIYSLGVTLYELLTRRPAFPTSADNKIAKIEPIPPRQVNSSIPRDLETIVMRSMAKRPEDRYASADALADDLRRVLRDEPIRARPIGWFGRLVRWSRRNPAVTGVAAAAAVLLAGFAAFHWLREAEHREKRQVEEAISDERYVGYLMASAANMIDSGQPGRTARALDSIREAASRGFRDEMWESAIRAIDQLDVTESIQFVEPDRPVQLLAVSPNGALIAGVEPSGRINFWSTGTGELWSSLGFKEPLTSIAWSPDSLHIVASSPQHVWFARVDRAAARLEDVRVVSYENAAVTFEPTGRQIAVWGNKLSLWDIQQGQFVWEQPSPHIGSESEVPPYRMVVWSPDGRLIAAVPSGEATVEFWKMPDGERQLPLGIVIEELTQKNNERALACLTFTPDGSRIVCGCADGSIRMYECESGALERTFRGHETPIRWFEFAVPGGQLPGSPPPPAAWLVSADNQDIRLWDVARDQQLAVLVRNLNGIRSASIDARGTLVACADGASTLGAWRLPDLLRHQVIGREPNRVSSVAASARGRRLAWADERGRVVIGDADLRTSPVEIESKLSQVQIVFAPSGNVVALAGDGDPPIQLYFIETCELKPVAAGKSAGRALAFTGSGDRLAVAHADGRLVVWNIQNGTPFATIESGPLLSLAASRDGKWLVGGGAGGDIHLWNTATMGAINIVDEHRSEVLALAFSPDGQSLASASRDGVVCQWRVPSLTREFCFEGPGGAVRALTYCLDGTTIATCGGDGRVFLWCADRAGRIGALTGRSTGRFDVLTTTGDGRSIIAAGGPKQTNLSSPGGIEMWNLEAIRLAVIRASLPDWCSTDSR